MFWRKKSDGFDWHKHIRTTIKLRREARKQKIDDVVDMAVGGLKGAGKAGAAASASGLDTVSRAIGMPFVWAGRLISNALTWLSGGLAALLTPIGRLMERRGLAPILGLVAIVSALLGIGRAQVEGWDPLALLLAGSGLVISLALFAPPLFSGRGPAILTTMAERAGALWRKVPGLTQISVPAQRGLTAGALIAAVGGAGWLASGTIGSFSHSAVSAIPGLSRPAIEGTATAVSGDTLRLNGQLVRLSGIEAPELDQTCGGQGREARWRCGEAARNQLRELIRGKTVRCDVGSGDKGQCKAGSIDLAADLVARGHVFAQQGLFSAYGRAEQDARNAKRGLWKASAERPEEFRNRLWETAKKAAPQGCPIKGQITRNERLYVVPWQPTYTRVRVRQDRGERWFCTEQEALAAGWKRLGV